MMDIDEATLEKAMATITWSLGKLEEKGKLKETKEDIITRIDKTMVIDSVNEADLIIEAIYENMEVKQDVFNEVEQICPAQIVFGTNTSSIPITELASAQKYPCRVVGIHFFNPVQRMQLVEIVRGLKGSDHTMRVAWDFVVSLGKEPVVVNHDISGFIVNRINGMAFLEALRLLERGIASAGDIDKTMRLGLGYPMWPFELMDLVGLDVVLNARVGVYNETRDPSYFPPAILQRIVASGQPGRKTKRGFYDYSK